MPLSIGEIMRGAQVAVAFDDRGRRVNPQRRGVITKVETWIDMEGDVSEDNGDPRNGIKAIWVKFDKNGESEKVQNRHLALIKGFDQTEYGRMKREENNARGEAAESEPTIIIDKTEIEHTKPLDSSAVDEFEAPPKRGPGRPRKNPIEA